jgi:excisionase family DNA binding protein
MKKTDEATRLLTTQEAARKWNIPKKAIYRLVREGKLRPFIGFKSWRFRIGDIDEVLERL